MIRRFLLCPFLIATLLTGAWLATRVYHVRVIYQVLWLVVAPPLFVSHYFPWPIVFFFAAVCWAAFIFAPYWASFRLGKLSATATQLVIFVVAAVLTAATFIVALSGFPSH